MKPDPYEQIADLVMDELSYLPEAERIPQKFMEHMTIKAEKIFKETSWLDYQKRDALETVLISLKADRLMIFVKDFAGRDILAVSETYKLNAYRP